MKKITVNASKSYDITIGAGILKDAGKIVRQSAGGQIAAVVTDDIVDALYGEKLTDSLAQSGYQAIKYVIPNGEASKNGEQFLSIINFLGKEKLSRTDVVIAFGGGVVGDLAGFAAASYMRGVNFVQIPTTLLAAVDSSVGGKTAINISAGKNLAGAFYQPNAVICDIALFSSLPNEIYKDGCAEVIKHGIIADRELFDLYRTPICNQYEDTIARNVGIKSKVVESDEFERGARKLLNFGHTVGHAVEQLSSYKISHGRAVAIGMAIETRMACAIGLCSSGCLREITDMLKLYDLPVSTTFDASEIADGCLADKKRDGGKITMVFPVKVGECILHDISVTELETLIQSGIQSELGG